ncbi:DEAD/DEAH box helicase [Comamonas aquatica]|jgi:ATP-dependent RNA helicase RhlE|uniref:ATP-dependent RNA helicase RhlE n=3 Tax=Comamonas aquatica TaxID=225991 RepID=A0AA35GHM5_9BURK|nr:DEAD/DEAH box helicase [Comamonas aquatica]CAB5666395.1 ATP-dependent RNA helicase rhlE [Comamonas aquatica]CAB5671623.1 ATP-dependent RNA helicase rhlE [Comamonas aquatica]CAC9226147.1 ATP-dependent RNA helicase rhlE [Comamonas aquatica]CAC9682899.1 ATP-dependent RNA helicase rhlE [Comamonas aquatica]
MTFEELNLAPAIVKAVLEQGYENPTPIQAQAIPAVLTGKDLLAGAQTGTGKTAAFSLPILHRLTQGGTSHPAGGIRALILTPTRELAAQIEENIRGYSKYLDISSTVIFGGVGMKPQIDRIRKGVDILVATPGRLLDLQQQGFMDLSQVEVLVLDEADRMLDMGFIHDVKKILALVPSNKQSLLFSATFSDDIRALANGLLKNPESIQVTPRNTTVQRIKQVIHPVGRAKKKQVLLHIINDNQWNQVLVFTRTKFGANNVAEFLTKNGVTAMALHGNKSQSARTQALAGFKTGELRALVATDIAARGIDIDELPHVVNYEIPNVPEDYVHRIGRTGRAGREGHAVSLVCMDEEGFMMEIERFTKQEIPVVPLEGFGPDEGEKAEPIAMGRQTIWGGAGKPPSRDVMQAAAKAARQEMMERIRTTKSAQSDRGGQRNPRAPRAEGQPADGEAGASQGARRGGARRPARQGFAPRDNAGTNFEGRTDGNAERAPRAEALDQDGQPRRSGQGYNRSRQRPSRDNPRGAEAPRGPASHANAGGQPRPARQPGGDNYGNSRFEDQPPRPNAHLGTQLGNPVSRGPRAGGSAQPDPTRTSIDLMMERPRRAGGGGFRGNNGGGGMGGGGNRRRSGGGGGGGFNR